MESDQKDDIPNVDGPTTNNIDKNSLNQNICIANGYARDLNIDGETSLVNKHDDVGNLPSVPYVYRQDIVRHKKSGSIGIVNEVAGDSDSDSDSDSSITDEEDDEDDLEEEDEHEGDDAKNDGEASTTTSKSKDKNKNNDTYKNGSLQADQVRVSWMNDTDPIQHVNDITVIDRGFLHGDYVASASDPIGQVGVVQDVHISVDLLGHDGSIIKGVSSRDLRRVREFAVGDYVVLGPWLGRIDDVLDNVTVLIDDGSVCKVMGAEPLRLKSISKSFFDEDENFPYYPGQRVRASSSSVFKNSRWLTGLWKANKLEGTVTKVTTGSVFIYWIASAGYGPDSSTAPAEEQSPKNLKLLSCFAHANWQIGDYCLLSSPLENSSSISLDNGLVKLELHDPVKKEIDSSQLGNACDLEELALDELDENNELMDIDPVVAQDRDGGNNDSHEFKSCSISTSVSKEPVHETWPLHRKKIRRVVMRREKKVRKKEENFERALLITTNKTAVDVAWQDGTTELGVDSVKLIPIDSPGDHEFLAEQYVVEKASDDIDNASEPRRAGVVKSVNAKERTACVRWLKLVARPEDPREFEKEEIVSVYELEGHQDYEYSYGDVVVRLSPVSVSVQASDGESARVLGPDTSKCSEFENGADTPNNEASLDFSDLSWVGNITGLRNGDIEVTWANGMISTVGPQAIFVVGRDDDDDTVAAGSEVSDAASWETVNDEETNALENSQEEVGPQNATYVNSDKEESVENNSSGKIPAISFPLAALDFVTRLATGIFSRGKKNEDQEDSDSNDANELQSHGVSYVSKEYSSDDSSSQKSSAIENLGEQTGQGKTEDHVVSEIPVSANTAEAVCNLRTELDVPKHSEHDTCNFKRFDTATDPSDHYFLGSNTQVNNGRKWLKKVQQDWNILQNNLPDGIYVRVYEVRMDLLTAVIVGAYGTPYQDGLFFFDFHLPPEYPDVPPSAHYHSGGWRINPNLYEEGKVCLSLLNTWTGRGNEVWDPVSSSILQVLVSLQGLVLNSKPYFNEAGYDKQTGTAEGEKNSFSYNENTFLLNCKTMMHLMRKPPKDFEELVKEHFRRRGYYILKACDAYMKGSLIGSLTKDASVSKEEKPDLNSVGFKLMLAKIVPKLYSSLHEVGADCLEFKHMLET